MSAIAAALHRYDPTAMRREIDGARHYVTRESDVPFASVTSVLSRTSEIESSFGFRRWRSNMEAIEPGFSEVARDVAAARGSKLDAEATQHLLAGTEPGPEADAWLRSIAPVLRQWNAIATVELAAGCCWHAIDRVAGTIDILIRIGGKWYLFDLKTSAQPWSDAKVAASIAQLGGYASCLRWTYDISIDGCGFVVALAPDPETGEDRTAQVKVSGPGSFTVDAAERAWSDRLSLYRSITAPARTA